MGSGRQGLDPILVPDPSAILQAATGCSGLFVPPKQNKKIQITALALLPRHSMSFVVLLARHWARKRWLFQGVYVPNLDIQNLYVC